MAPNDQTKFATYTRDSATGLDYAMKRYYSSSLGRFMTPDPYHASGKGARPQSWNRYAYTRSDPVNRYDPAGLDDQDPCAGNPNCVTVTAAQDPLDYMYGAQNGYVPDIGFDQQVEAGLGQSGTGIPSVSQIQQAMWQTTLATLQAAASFTKSDAAGLNSQNCQKDLQAIQQAGSGNDSTDSITSAAGSVSFQNAFAPVNQSITYNNVTYDSPAAFFNANPSAFAFTFIGSSYQLWTFAGILDPTNISNFGLASPSLMDGRVLHEILHSLGFTDSQVENGLGLPVGPNTDAIGQDLAQDCFH